MAFQFDQKKLEVRSAGLGQPRDFQDRDAFPGAPELHHRHATQGIK